MTGRSSPIDLNADVGESFGPWPMGPDEALIPLVTSVNIACGFHAGDPVVIERTIRLALASGVAIGAHPGYPDREGFGRRDLAMSAEELEASILYQVAALAGMVTAAGGTLRHVKAHGALYNRAAGDPAVAEPIARAVRRISPDLVLVGPPGSELVRAAERDGPADQRRRASPTEPTSPTARSGRAACPMPSTPTPRSRPPRRSPSRTTSGTRPCASTATRRTRRGSPGPCGRRSRRPATAWRRSA